MPFDLGWPELLVILLVALLLFGGTRLAGLGKASGQAIREFRDETKGLRSGKDKPQVTPKVQPGAPTQTQTDKQKDA